MVKVLQVTGTMNRGGAEVMLMDILRNKPEDILFDFLVNNPPEDLYRIGVFDNEIRDHGCTIRHIGTQLKMGPRKYIKRFTQIYGEVQPDVVHIHLNAKCGIIALAAHKAGCKRIIAHCHANIRYRGSLLSKLFNEVELFLQKFLIAWYATDWWGCSIEANRRLYWPWIREHSKVINNAIDIEAYRKVTEEDVALLRASYGIGESTLVLGNVGRIVPHKNIAFVIDVMRELRLRGRDVAFVVAGRNDSSDYTANMIQRARDLGVPRNRLFFIGERSDIPAVMNTYDVFVGPALKEGFGLVAVEAQAAGVPCVLYNGFPSVVDMQVGLCTFMSDFDPKAWADAIELSAAKSVVSKEMIYKSIRDQGFDARENALRVCEMYNHH